MQDPLPKKVEKTVQDTLQAFKTGETAIQLEIQKFKIYLKDLMAFREAQEQAAAARVVLHRSREEFVEAAMKKHDLEERKEAEWATWNWSPLFRVLYRGPTPESMSAPFDHDVPEFNGVLAWMAEEVKSSTAVSPCPPLARAQKIFTRAALGGSSPSICPLTGPTREEVGDHYSNLRVAVQDVCLLGQLLFPGMDSADVEALHDAFTSEDTLSDSASALLDSAFSWLRFVFFRSCLDMCNVGMQDHLAVLWTNGGGPGRHEAVKALQGIMLLRENADFHWLLGSVDCTREWPKADITDELFRSAGAFQMASKAICLGRLDNWRSSGRDGLSDLEGVELPSQMYSTQQLALPPGFATEKSDLQDELLPSQAPTQSSETVLEPDVVDEPAHSDCEGLAGPG